MSSRALRKISARQWQALLRSTARGRTSMVASSGSSMPAQTQIAMAVVRPIAVSRLYNVTHSRVRHASTGETTASTPDDYEPTVAVEEKEADLTREQQIVRHLEFYFSDLNFPTDKFMLDQAKGDLYGTIPVEFLLNFARLSKVKATLDEIRETAKQSNNLVYDPEDDTIRRLNPILHLNKKNAYMINWGQYFRNAPRPRELKEALTVFFKMPHRIDYLALQNALRRAAHFDDVTLVDKIVNAMEKKGWDLLPQHLNALLWAYGKVGAFDKAMALADLCKKNKIQLEANSWTSLINTATKNGNLSQAFDVLTTMRQHGVVPDQLCYQILLRSCGIEDRQKLKQLFTDMVSGDEAPSVLDYQFLMSFAAATDELELAEEAFKQVLESGQEPTSNDFDRIMEAHSLAGNVDECFALLQEMQDRNMPAGLKHYNKILSACNFAMDLQRAEDVLNMIYENGLKPNINTFNSLLDLYRRRRMVNEARALYSRVLADATMEAKPITFYLMLHLASRVHDIDLLEDLLQDMRNRGVPLEARALNIVVYCYAMARGPAAGTAKMQELSETMDMRPDRITYNILMTAAGTHEDMSSAQNYIDKMRAMNIEPDEVTYTIMLNTAFRQDKPKLMLDIYKTMKENGIAPTDVTFHILLRALKQYKLADLSTLVSEDMDIAGVDPKSFVFTKGKVKDLDVDTNAALRNTLEESLFEASRVKMPVKDADGEGMYGDDDNNGEASTQKMKGSKE
eukprot:Clim_evm9s248 gene=Clim_evmTU9s248